MPSSCPSRHIIYLRCDGSCSNVDVRTKLSFESRRMPALLTVAVHFLAALFVIHLQCDLHLTCWHATAAVPTALPGHAAIPYGCQHVLLVVHVFPACFLLSVHCFTTTVVVCPS
mmetsp:Transcript_3528/g.4742  ORF Transcript_3528/g.4742 Transcript_3528/m.4742 type:complete len:114 (+) Transcript_3528:78-419(+)